MTQQNDNNLMNNPKLSKPLENQEYQSKPSLFKRDTLEAIPHNLIYQILNALPFSSYSEPEQERMFDAGVLTLKEMDPKDPLEGMIMTQMIATHTSIMECYRLSVHDNLSIEQKTNYINNANKLVRSYTMLQDSLQRYRGKANHEQKIIVQHIQVSEGGQAIVGDVNKE